MQKKEKELFCPANLQEWRQWLEENHCDKPSVWLVYYKKKSGQPTISWSEAVDEALCFGWIDSTINTLDEHRFMQYFSKRKTTSVWSGINKEKVDRLVAEGRMQQAGLDSIETARKNGSWNALNEVDALLIPKDLGKAFKEKKGSKPYFLGLSKSVRKSILQWLSLAKRPATRQKRIQEIAQAASEKTLPPNGPINQRTVLRTNK